MPSGASSSSVVARAVEAIARWSARWVPNAFVIACLLTLVTFGMVLLVAGRSPIAAVGYWTKGFWELLEFTMQMALIVLTGYTVAVSPVAARSLAFIAGLARSNRGAVALMGLVSMTASWLHWGLGLIAGPIFLQFLIRKHPHVDYRLAVAAGYLGSTCTWHAGLSGSAPLLMATPKNFMEAQVGLIPVSMTTFSAFNLALAAVVVTVMTVALLRLYPRADRVRSTADVLDGRFTTAVADAPADSHANHVRPASGFSLALAIENRYALNLIMGVLGLSAWWSLYAEGGYRVSLNIFNFAFLFLALLLHPSPASFSDAASKGASYLHGIIIQFPFYAGMYGLIRYSGLAETIGRWFVAIASVHSFPLIIYWYSGILSYFIPSGGSKWAVEAPYVLSAAQTLGVPPAQAILAYAWGDMSTHFLQPFWAIPLLAIARVDFKDIIGYLAILFLVNAVVVSIAFALMPYLW
ncbi:MAG: short-chain fatty acid transporter [Blastocatellia bacterium]|nr:MAG: short-chain fatty acid transporter [Blastocatellia bacterium]